MAVFALFCVGPSGADAELGSKRLYATGPHMFHHHISKFYDDDAFYLFFAMRRWPRGWCHEMRAVT